MSNHDLHHDWLALIEISGPFLAVPVLKEAFPQGLEELDGTKRKRLRQAYEEWRDALETDDPHFEELHTAWIDEVLSRGLELDEEGNILLKKAFRTERFDVIITSNSSGNATSTVALTTFSDDKAAVNVMPLADLGADARWWVSAQTNTSITVSFAGLPVSATRNIAITASQTVIE